MPWLRAAAVAALLVPRNFANDALLEPAVRGILRHPVADVLLGAATV